MKPFPVTYDSADDLPEIVPVFPLNGAVFFPRANLPLNIFEPRYFAMIDDAMRTQRIIGMIQPRTEDARPKLHEVGCAGRITQYGETDDGRMVISLKGICRFRVADELTVMTPYRQVRADYAPFAGDFIETDASAQEQGFDRKRYLATLKLYLKAIAVQIDWDWVEKAPAEVLINAFAMLAPLQPSEKQAMLEAGDLKDRTAAAVTLMEVTVAEAGISAGGAPGGSSIN
jgi:Lon protease-like protein